MCGITGVVSLDNSPIDTSSLKDMCDIISHRGPDDAGYFLAQDGRLNPLGLSYQEAFSDRQFNHISPMLPPIDSVHGEQTVRSQPWNLFLGHRRLSIIDISQLGHQPMPDLSKSIWVAFNGEIYNYKEIRDELKSFGHTFKTKSDTEVIIYAYLQWGIRSVEKFNGMFAISLWDKRSNQMFLIRDRYGVKPLYYSVTENNHFVFASESKSILKYPHYKPELDSEALLEYFTFQNIFTDRTLYKNIKLLPAGNYLEINLNSGSSILKQHEYWDYHFEEPETPKPESYYIETLDELFQQAVKRQMVSDVEVGTYLSGGMDSGSITAIAAQEKPYIKTFTVGFDLRSASGIEMGFDEREKSEFMSYKFKTEHYEMVLKSGDMERCMKDLVWHIEDPRVGQSYPNYYAAKLSSKFTKVILTGTGGDELFAGYPWRYYRAVGSSNFTEYCNKYYDFWQRLIPSNDIKQVFEPIWDQVSHIDTKDIFRNVFKHHNETLTRPEDFINHSLYFEAKTFLNGLFLVEDKLSMAHSLESRVPFMDNDLVDFAMKIPAKYKLANLNNVKRINENEQGNKTNKYFQKTNDGKIILRKVMEKYIPKIVTEREKQGFSAPDASWFKGDSIDYVKEKILAPDCKIYEYLDFKKTSDLINDHLDAKENRRLLIWSLLNFEEFLSLNIGKKE